MTLQEAIKHCYDVANNKCGQCAEEHRQLAQWLEELERMKMEKEKPAYLSLIAASAAVLSFWADKGCGSEDNKYRRVSIEFRNHDSEFEYSGIVPKEELDVVVKILAGVLSEDIPVNVYQDIGAGGMLRGVRVSSLRSTPEWVLLRGPFLTRDEKINERK